MDARTIKEIEKRVELEDFPENFQRFAKNIGITAALQITKENGGYKHYVPVYDNVTQKARNRLIKEEFNGSNYQQLAVKYGISETTVREVIDGERRRKAKADLIQNQTVLNFEGF